VAVLAIPIIWFENESLDYCTSPSTILFISRINGMVRYECFILSFSYQVKRINSGGVITILWISTIKNRRQFELGLAREIFTRWTLRSRRLFTMPQLLQGHSDSFKSIKIKCRILSIISSNVIAATKCLSQEVSKTTIMARHIRSLLQLLIRVCKQIELDVPLQIDLIVHVERISYMFRVYNVIQRYIMGLSSQLT
jgi:hypothetical protein